MNLLYVILQRRRQLLAAGLVFTVLYLIYELALVREYTAFAQVRAAAGPNGQGTNQDFTAHVHLVQSADFLQGMSERLSDDDRRQMLAPFRHWFGPAETAGELLLERRIVTPNPVSQMIDLGFTHPDPKVAARVANALAAEFVRQSDAMNDEQKKKILGDLQNDADKLNKQVDTLQSQMDGYVGKYGLAKLDASEIGADFSSLQELNRKAVDAKSTLDRLSQERQQIQQEVLSGEPLWNLSFIAEQPGVQGLLKDLHDFLARLDQLRAEKYAEDAPPMVELKGRITNVGTELASAADVISKQVNSDYDAALNAAGQASTRLDAARQDALNLSTARTEYQSLLGLHDSAQKLAASKMVELSNQQANLNLAMTTYALLANAEPPTSADSPPWVRFILRALGAGVTGSLLLAVGFAAFRPPPAAEREEHDRRRRRHRRFHSSTRRR